MTWRELIKRAVDVKDLDELVLVRIDREKRAGGSEWYCVMPVAYVAVADDRLVIDLPANLCNPEIPEAAKAAE